MVAFDFVSKGQKSKQQSLGYSRGDLPHDMNPIIKTSPAAAKKRGLIKMSLKN